MGFRSTLAFVRLQIPVITALAIVVAAFANASSGRAASSEIRISPGLFEKISSGVAYITTYDCSGRAVGTGSGFLVGATVVMTARHVLENSCQIRVKVSGERFEGVRWVYWRTGRKSSGRTEDVATVKLERPASGYLFAFRTSPPPAGTNLAMIGYPLGNRISLNQGKIIRRGRSAGVPLVAVKMLGAEGASGSPFVDDQGRVVGILQLGLGAEDVLGQRTAGVLVGIDLSTWWGPDARRDLCRSYPNGGITGCTKTGGGAKPPAAPSPPSPPTTTPRPPTAPMALALSECWVTTSESWDPSAKAYTLRPDRQSIFVVTRFNRPSGSTDHVALRFELARPDGTRYGEGAWDESGKSFALYRVKWDLKGRGELPPAGGEWKATVTLNDGTPCSYGVRVERRLNPLEVSTSATQFDPYWTYFLSVSWRLVQDVESTASLQLRLVTPMGLTADTETLFINDYSTSGTASLFLPSCFRSSFTTTDTCLYGTYRIDVMRDGVVVGSLSLTGVKT